MSEVLKHALRHRARVEGDLVMVDEFLNHRVEPAMLDAIGLHLAERLGACDAVITSEASGIAPAMTTAAHLGVPMVFAKKHPTPGPDITRQVESPTKGDRPWLRMSHRSIAGLHRVVVVDDFLSAGRTATALVEMLRSAGLEVDRAGFCIEKAYAGGRTLLEAHGVEVISAAIVLGIEEGVPVVS